MIRVTRVALAAALTAFVAPRLAAQQVADTNRFTLRDIFELEWAADPEISPDGSRIVFERSSFDIMHDRAVSDLWIVNADGSNLRALLPPDRHAGSPRWSPDGSRLAFVAHADDEGSEIFVRWMDTGQEAKLTHVEESPGGLAWSPDGKWIAFTMFVPEHEKPLVELPAKPKGADWGPAIEYIDQVQYRMNGAGYLRRGHRHIFVIPADGGTPRQITDGPYTDGAPEWMPDGKSIVFSANRHADAEYATNNSEIYSVSVADGTVRALTDRVGPDNDPA
ncbi:MAG TPA: DPP IV N-terminal domain-containing protein, partial [Gemmatimonadales bacterium]|nr:DPP IV N-terminal domain-containing protein [Gemmatimonadales bacterium]